MKFIYSLVAVLAITFSGLSQKGVYVKYETQIDASGEEGEMMAMMMNGSTMEVASSVEKTYVKSNMGTMMTMEMEMNLVDSVMTMFMSGMMGNMAFQGKPDDLGEDETEEETPEVKLLDETKEILGVTCKKAVISDDQGNTATYWYTQDFKRPEGMDQMPNNIPGLCLEFEVGSEEVIMKYTAIEFNDKADMSNFAVVIPEGVEVGSLQDMQNMGGGM
jgi:GLPGLI family protein